jgi:subtilisin family serine protease
MAPRATSPALARGAESESPQAGRPIPGQYIVVFRDDVADVDGKVQEKVRKANGRLKHAYKAALKGFAGELSDEAAAALRADPDVAYVEQDQEVTTVGTQANATWGLDRIDQQALPLSTTYGYAGEGAGVTAYIIDTGILTEHTEFGGRAAFGANYADRKDTDCNGHGTHVAGTVGGAAYGVAKRVRLVGVKVLNCRGSGTNSGVIAGIDWVAQNRVRPAVANLSLGGGASLAVDQAVGRLVGAGVFVAVAAGNESQDACNASPARAPEATTVGATTRTDARASYSNFGKCVDIFAPGSAITSAWHTGTAAINTISGTSMASPHVAGAGALYLGANTGAAPAAVGTALTDAATDNKVTDPGAESPNRLLFTGGL